MNVIARRFVLVAAGIAIFLLAHSLLASYVLERYREQRADSVAVKKELGSSRGESGNTGSVEKIASNIARLNY